MAPVPHSPYSPDVILNNFFFISLIKTSLKGNDVEKVKQKMAETLKGVKIDKFQCCFEQWKKCLIRCIASNGECFGGD